MKESGIGREGSKIRHRGIPRSPIPLHGQHRRVRPGAGAASSRQSARRLPEQNNCIRRVSAIRSVEKSVTIVEHQRQAIGSVPEHSGSPSGDAPVSIAAVTRAALTAIRCLDLPFPGTSFGPRMLRNLKLLLSLSLLLAALSVGLCRLSLAQGDADLAELRRLEQF
jgi:hypothetical protein